MTARNEKPVQELITSQTGVLANLREKVAQLNQLNQLLYTQLDPNLIPHCRVANLKDNSLALEVESSAWSLRLRYCIPELLKQLRSFPEFKNLKTIEWFIRSVTTEIEERVTVHRPPLTTENVELIRDTAEHVTNEKLKRALNKLAKNS